MSAFPDRPVKTMPAMVVAAPLAVTIAFPEMITSLAGPSVDCDQAERHFRREAAKEDKRDKVNEKRRKLEAKVDSLH